MFTVPPVIKYVPGLNVPESQNVGRFDTLRLGPGNTLKVVSQEHTLEVSEQHPLAVTAIVMVPELTVLMVGCESVG